MTDTANIPYATLTRRIEASANTFIPAFVFMFFIAAAVHSAFPVDRFLIAEGVSAFWADMIAGLIQPGIPAFCVVLDGVIHRASFGMRKRNLVFRNSCGEQIAFLHCGLRLMVGIALIPLIPVSIVTILRDAQRRTLADMLCGTNVQNRPVSTEPHCEKCGYQLTGLVDSRCPECGTPFSFADRVEAP